GNYGGAQSENSAWMGREHSILIHLPTLATLAFKLEKQISLERHAPSCP
ncbi:MAG: 1,4-alpha-glucan branching enzyme GlgB, partial [Spartobacteria bacterium]|nr:1,4-alpha-glucan branching enzyme GlgB [Spartobacteria bacterium]